jgi:Uma2 family endonuclease
MSTEIARKLFNVHEYYQMAEVGILSKDDRVELIEGEIIKMSPINPPHASCVDRLNSFLNQRLMERAIVRIQNPIRLHDLSEPEPDIALLLPREDFYSQSHPTTKDVLLIIEVSESTERFDHHIKLPMYARAGIKDYWIVNLSKEIVETYHDPINGKYTRSRKVSRGKSVVLRFTPDVRIPVDFIFG